MKRRTLSGYLFLTPYVLLFTIFIVFPLFFGLGISFYDWEMLSNRPPRFVGVSNYAEALTSHYFWKALWATFKFVLMAAPATVVLALTFALGCDFIRSRRQQVVRVMFFLPCIVSVAVAGLLWRWFFNTEFGLFNSLLAPLDLRVQWLIRPNLAMISIVLMTLWWTVGGPLIILLAGLQAIPRHYYEAAALDGAKPWQRLRHITIPLLRPILLFVLIMNIIGAFQIFGQTFIITRGGPELATRVIVQYIYETAFNNYRMGYASAMSWLLFVVIAVFALSQFRLMRER